MSLIISVSCVACGSSIIYPVGVRGEYCSRECFRVGRAFCKFCNKPLSHPSKPGFKKDFCDKNCSNRYRQIGGPISPSLLDEWNRSTCKACGKPITQSKTHTKQFCSSSCCNRYHPTQIRGQNILQKWGGFAPETRKALLDVEKFMGLTAAKRMAAAIDREYILRKRGSLTERSRAHRDITCHCKTCGKEFVRRSWSQRDRDYCSSKCRPKMPMIGENNPQAKLTQEQVDEIRHLYKDEHLSLPELARKYAVDKVTIFNIVHYRTWKPENDLQRKEG